MGVSENTLLEIIAAVGLAAISLSLLYLYITVIAILLYLVYEISNFLSETKYTWDIIDFDIVTGRISKATLALTIVMMLLSLGLLFSGYNAYGGILFTVIDLLIHLLWKKVHDRIK